MVKSEEVIYILAAFEKLPEKKQKKILNAAASVFAEEGYHFGSISKICRKAGISNGALYKYFENKESLFLAVLNHGADLVENELYKKYTSENTSIYETIRNFLKELVHFTKKNRNHVKIYSDLGSSSMNRFANTASDKYKNATSLYIIQLVEQSKKKGEIKSCIRTDLAACLIDNYITLFSYSIVSEYHIDRFNAFFDIYENISNEDTRIELIVESLKVALK